MIDPDTPEILRQFLAYHETIKGQSPKTIDEYHLDLRMFLRFLVLMRSEMPIDTDLETISVRHVDVEFLRSVTTNDIFDFLRYLARERRTQDGSGLGASARARKLSAIKSFFKYLTTRTKLLDENPAQDIEYPRMRRALPKYLTLEESRRLLAAVDGPNRARDYAILLLFLNCGIRRAELVGLNRNDIYNDRIRVTGKGNKERFVYFGETTREALDTYLPERNKIVLDDDRALFGSRDHRRLSVTAVHRLVKKHMLAAGLDPEQYSAHKLRHTAATLMVANGVDLRTVQEVLGHEHLNTTEIYTHIENTELKIAAEANPLSRPAPKETHYEKDPVI